MKLGNVNPTLTPGRSQGVIQESCSVDRFQCLFTHDIRRKAKRWQDGYLQYHSFNRRVMVYNTSGYLIGDIHWRHDMALQDGDELELDKGVLVQVGELMDKKEPDLSQLREKQLARSQEKSAMSEATPPLRTLGKPKSLNEILGMGRAPIGRSTLPKKSPFELRQESQASSPSPMVNAATGVFKKQKLSRAVPEHMTPTSIPHSTRGAHPSADQENISHSGSHMQKAKVVQSSRTLSVTSNKTKALSHLQNNAISRSANVSLGKEPFQRPQMKPTTGPENSTTVAHLQRRRPMPGSSNSRTSSNDKGGRCDKSTLELTKRSADYIRQDSMENTIPMEDRGEPDIMHKDSASSSSSSSRRSVGNHKKPRLAGDLSRPRSSDEQGRAKVFPVTEDRSRPAMATLHLAPEKPRKKLMFMDIMSTAKTTTSKRNPDDYHRKRTNDRSGAPNEFKSASSPSLCRKELSRPQEASAQEYVDEPNQSLHHFLKATSNPRGDIELTGHEKPSAAVKQETFETSDFDIEGPFGHCDDSSAEDTTRQSMVNFKYDANWPGKAFDGDAAPKKVSHDNVPETTFDPLTSSLPTENEGLQDEPGAVTDNSSRCQPDDYAETTDSRVDDFSQSSPARYFAELRSRSMGIECQALAEPNQPTLEAAEGKTPEDPHSPSSPRSIGKPKPLSPHSHHETRSVLESVSAEQRSSDSACSLALLKPSAKTPESGLQKRDTLLQSKSTDDRDGMAKGAWTIEAICLFDYWPAGRMKPSDIEKLL
ncbi:hypothetical protein KEM56_006276 [Ascosphaera pollenicola]|nr:hypothetical protein KEM56_006276 [Ascosphaera pollenicola]